MDSRPKIMLTTMFRALFQIPTDNPDLMQAQLKALCRQIPLLYFILVVSTDFSRLHALRPRAQ